MNPIGIRIKTSRCPVAKGQILPLLRDKLRSDNTNSLNYGSDWFRVDSVSKTTSAKKEPMWRLALTPVEWDPVSFDWSPCKEGGVSPHPFDISVSSQTLDENFGVKSRVASDGYVSALIGELFRRAGKREEFESHRGTNFDALLHSVTNRAITRSGFTFTNEDREDIFQIALTSLTQDPFLSKYTPEKGSFTNFLFGVFFNHVRNAIRTHTHSGRLPETTSPVTEDGTSVMEFMQDPALSVEDTVTSRQVVADFREYLQYQARGDILLAILDGLSLGYTQTEIAQKVGLAPSSLTPYTKRVLIHLRDYALESQNDNLLTAMEAAAARKNLKLAAEVDYYEVLRDVFQSYDPELIGHVATDTEPDTNEVKTREEEKVAERVPVGETIRIQRKPMPSFEEITRKVVQDPEKSSNQASEDVESYLRDLVSADELIEHDGKLVALKVVRRE